MTDGFEPNQPHGESKLFVHDPDAPCVVCDRIRRESKTHSHDDQPKDYAQLYLDGGEDPTFDQIDGFLLAHFNARARYIDDLP